MNEAQKEKKKSAYQLSQDPNSGIPSESDIKAMVLALTSNKVGRPTKYTKELGEEICERIINGESLLRICQSEHVPNYATVMRWLDKHIKFRDNYAQARVKQAQTYADLLMEMAMSEKDVNRARLMSDNAKWTASKLLPKVYGEKVDIEQNVNVTFHNGVPRPHIVEAHATSSVGKVIEGEVVPKKP